MPSSRSLGLVGRSVRTAFKYTFQPRASGSLQSRALLRLISVPPRRLRIASTRSCGWNLRAGGPVGDAHGEVELDRILFDAEGLTPETLGAWKKWPLAPVLRAQAASILIATSSMGNPHAGQLVDDVHTAPVEILVPLIECHPRQSGVQNQTALSHQCARGEKLVQHRLNPVRCSLVIKKLVANLH